MGDQGAIKAGTELDRAQAFNAAFLVPLVLGVLLNPINSSVVATALTAIARDFPGDPSAVAWLISSLYLAGAIAQPVLGRLADMFGPKRVLLFGMAVVAVGGLVGAWAPNLAMLVFSRVLIGIGSSAGYPCAMAMVRQRSVKFDMPPPPRVIAILSAAGTATATMGPAIGGLLVAGLGWRWIFALNLPLAVAGLILAIRQLPGDGAARRFDWRDLDLPGMVLFSAAVIALMTFLMELKDSFNIGLLAAGAALLAVMVAAELRREGPFIDVRMIAGNVGLRRLYVRHILHLCLMYAFFFAFPQWMQVTLGYSPGEAGLMMLPYGIATVAASFTVTRAGKLGAAKLIGGATMLVACGMLFLLKADTSLAQMLFMGVLFGAAGGAVLIVNQHSLMIHAPVEQIGAAAGLLRTCQSVGAMMATPLAAYVLAHNSDDAAIHRMSLVMMPLALLVLGLLVVDTAKRTVKAVG